MTSPLLAAARSACPDQPPVAPADLRALLDVDFTDQQLAAVTGPAQPGLVVAGAGSGKTTVMAARVVWLVLTGAARPEQVLGLTFTNKAAAELAARVRAALARALQPPGGGAGSHVRDPFADGEPTVATYHAYAGRLLAEHGLRLGLEPRARLLADATRFQLAGRVVRAAGGPLPQLAVWTLPTVVARVVALDAEMNEHVVTAAQLRSHDAAVAEAVRAQLAVTPAGRGWGGYRAELARVLACVAARAELLGLVEAFRVAKRDVDAVDFADQLAGAVALAEQHPEVSAAERDRFRVVILDEYQDTSVAQRRMLVGLFGHGHPVTAVGDPCQAIYGWRGASVANLDEFARHFASASGCPAARLPLSVNQRSGGRLLRLANASAVPLMRRHAVTPLSPRTGVESAGDAVVALHERWEHETAWLAQRLAHELKLRGLRPRDAAVLVRTRADMPALHNALLDAGLPVEVVGLGGLLSVPAVADVVATLSLLDNPAANVALVRLLAGPRWRIGQRDLALLGARARELVRRDLGSAGAPGSSESDGDGDGPRDAEGDGDGELGQALAGADPADLAALSDALADPGGAEYSPQARSRFAAFAAELTMLRRHAGEPLLDLVGRVLRATGLDVELTASPEAVRSGAAGALAAFLDHAAGFRDLEGESSLSAFLAFLGAAEEHEHGLDASSPGNSDAVALLTVHKAKGLEWEVVALPDLVAGVFPSTKPIQSWTTGCAVLPAPLRGDWNPDATPPLPAPADWSKPALAAFKAAHQDHQHSEELRLAYVALTRARSLLLASGHWWGPTQKRPRGPSEVLHVVYEHCRAGFGEVASWAPAPQGTRPEVLATGAGSSWPMALDVAASGRRRDAADQVRELLAGRADPTARAQLGGERDGGLDAAESALVAEWDRAAQLLLAEARGARLGRREIELPASLTASQVVRLGADPGAFARELIRPMPRPPAPAAALGTRFHAWVEQQFGLRPLLDADELPGATDEEQAAAEGAELADLQAAFRRSGWLERRPVAVEAPFELVLGGHVVRGRIDAVYADGESAWHVVDWKTGREASDPLQLAVYRLAWARLRGVPPAQVRASFLTVRTGALVSPADLPAEAELVRLLGRTAGD